METHTQHTHTHAHTLIFLAGDQIYKYRHAKTFHPNAGYALNPFNGFSVAMVTCCRLTEPDVRERPISLATSGDVQRHQTVCVRACVESERADVCFHAMCQNLCSRHPTLTVIIPTNDETDCKIAPK